ncbi:Alpha-glucan water dikinase protein [Thalictrum thalictroides]|uniref:Alpha-glucan water dikinase protein n=1 Tax=Thalictrum thalictroides TaxID=46969 RepID=A0A7J6WEB9_THATH|nr:Alpha-glucan water dikinase protein [Thalictrum thalictroides]
MASSSQFTSNTQIPLVHQYDLGEGMLLQVKVYKSSHDSNTKVELQLRNCSKLFLLHWGAIYHGQTNWVLPADRPVGTKLFKQYALQTPFVKSGDIFFITIELRDQKIHAIEFVLKDERHDKWLKLNHKNFQIKIPEGVKIYSHTSIPKDLVERKAYFLWESMGRPRNSPQQQQENYEVALRDLQSQLSKGISLNELQSSFQAPGSKRAADNKESSSVVDSVTSSSYHRRHDVGQWIHQRSQGKAKISNLLSPGEGVGNGIVKWLLDEISQKEKDAERSLMHRFNIATELTERYKSEGELGLVGIMVWFRFMACRHLTWNKNYNVKPREISTAQDKFTNLLQRIYASQPDDRELIRLIMTTIGRGGQGDVGQRIRDEILVLQRNNDCKGGMMEEWHQKLHNNSSPDDVIICQALLDYVRSNLKIEIYWRTLNANGLTKSILRSYDRPIVSEPHFRIDSKDGLLRDLTSYLKTLKAVHTGADLESAIETFLGCSSQGNHFMKAVRVNNVGDVSSRLQECMSFVKMHADDKNIGPLMEKLLETRVELRPLLLASHEKLKDVIFLDLALDSAVRTTMERGLQELGNTHGIVFFISVMLQNLCLSTVGNEHLVYCAKDWYRVSDSYKPNDEQWALQAKAVIDRVRLALSDKSQDYHKMIQPSAQYLGNMLRVEKWAIDIFTEELIRTGSAATLSLLVNRLDPILRKIANLGCWQIISPVEVCGLVIAVSELITVQTKVYAKPTIIIANKVTGEEEIPDGVVGVLTPDMPDVLSHVSVRARNSKVCFATCFDQSILRNLKLKEGKMISIKLRSANLVISDIGSDMSQAHFIRSSIPQGTTLTRKTFGGKYALAAEEFTVKMVGAKSRNIQYLRGRVPSWIKIPTSVAIPFGVFETLLASDLNKDLSNKVSSFSRLVNSGDLSKLQAIQEIIFQMKPSSQLINELRSKMKSSRIPWPGDEGEERWNQGWQAIKKVWASKWNQRAFISCRKANINHDHVCMSVLIQEVISADYAFVIHTRNPSSGDSSEIYTEIVKGLGETLVGAYAGRAMSFIVKKSDLKSPIILGYPSKQIGLYIKKSLIFRSDSNGEDLEGYAGAGLYDSVPMDKEQKVVLDYSNDRLIKDKGFQHALFSKIAEVGKIIEDLYRSAQDIEGVVKDGEIYVVQTRPQM